MAMEDADAQAPMGDAATAAAEAAPTRAEDAARDLAEVVQLLAGNQAAHVADAAAAISSAKTSPRGLAALVRYILQEPDDDARCAALRGLARVLSQSSRGQFSAGEASFVFPDAYLSCSMDSQDSLSVPPLKLGALRGYTFTAWVWLEEATAKEHMNHQRVLYRFLTIYGYGAWCMIDLEASVIEVRTRSHGELGWQRARLQLGPGILQPRQWIHITVAHSQPYMVGSILGIFIDGVQRHESQLAYPKLEEHATENFIGQGLGGRFARPTLYEGAASQQQALELFAGFSRMRVPVPTPRASDKTLQKAPRSPNAPDVNEANSNKVYHRKQFSVARAGNLTEEGVNEIRENLLNLVKLAPRTLQDDFSAASAGVDDTGQRNPRENKSWRSHGEEGADSPTVRHEFQQRLKLDRKHRYEDLPVVFYYDARTCIGGEIEDVEIAKNKWMAVRVGGVLETIRVNGKRTQSADAEGFVEPQSLSYSKSLDGVSFGMPTRGMQVYARCLGKAAVVFDLDEPCSLECVGGVFPLFIALINLVPLEVKIQAQLLAIDGTSPSSSGDGRVLVHLIHALDDALFAREFYREDFAHFNGFALLGWVLQQIPRTWITDDLADALWAFVVRVGTADITLRCEGLLYVLLDYQTWGGASEATQRRWVRHMLQYVESHPAEARIAIGVQAVLDLLSLSAASSGPVDPIEEALPEGSPGDTSRGDAGENNDDDDDGEEEEEHEEAEVDARSSGNDDNDSDDDATASAPSQQTQNQPSQARPLWISHACVEDLVRVIRLFFSAPGFAEDDDQAASSSPPHNASEKTMTSAQEDAWDLASVGATPGPTAAEVRAIFNFVSRLPTAVATTLLLDTFDYMLLPLLVKTRSWTPTELAIARATYDAIQSNGGIDFILALGARAHETLMPLTAAATAAAAGSASAQAKNAPTLKREHSFNILGRLNNRSPATKASIKPVDSTDSAAEGADYRNKETPKTPIRWSPSPRPSGPRNGLLCSTNGVPARTRAAMVLLVGRMIQLEEQINHAAASRERSGGGGRGDQAAKSVERRQIQFGIVLRSIMPIPHVASFRLEESEVYDKVSREADANVLDAIVSVIMGSAAQWEGVDDFVPHDDTMQLALPDALPVLGGMLAALSKADEETKSIAAREILLKLSLIMKASYAAREQVTSLPRWQTWLIPVMLLQDKSLNHEDDNSADYLLGEVSTDLLCTLMEHETQRPDDSKAEASKLNRVQFGWAAWQGLAESAMRILKEKERSLVNEDLQDAKARTDLSSRSLVPEYNTVAELRATVKTSRVLRQTLERVWERLVVRLQAGGLHADAVRNFTYTIAMSEEVLLAGLNLLRLCPLSPGGMISSSSASTFVGPGASSNAPPLSCSARCVIDGRHDTKWVDVGRNVEDDADMDEPLPTTQSWVQYKYPTFSFQAANQRIARTRHRIVFYSVRSAIDTPDLDPSGWTLFGRNTLLMEGEQGGWTVLDRRSEVRFATRYQQVNCWAQHTGFFEEYRVVFDPPPRRGKLLRQHDGTKAFVKLQVGEVSFYECDVESWHYDLANVAYSGNPEDAIDAHLQEQTLVAAAMRENNGELRRFVRLALQTIKFIRSGSAHGSTPRMNRRQYKQIDESEARAQVQDMPKRAIIRCLGHFLRNAAGIPVGLLEETISLVRSFLADDLAAEAQGNRTLVLVLIHCIHNGMCHLQAVQNGSLTGCEGEDVAVVEDKLNALFALLATAVSVHPNITQGGGGGRTGAAQRDGVPQSIESFFQEWDEVWALPVQRALQRELEAEALHRHTSFRVERSSCTAMARRANPVEVAAYLAGPKGAKVVGLRQRKRLRIMDKSEDERVYTTQITRVTLAARTEHAWRKLTERYEVAEIVQRGLDSRPHHRLFRMSPFVEPALRVRTRLLRHPAGNPHFGAASGVKDRIKRQKAKEEEALQFLAVADNAHALPDQDRAEDSVATPDLAAGAGLDDADGRKGEVSAVDQASGDATETSGDAIATSTSWENIGAKLSKQINITDTSLMTRQDVDEEEEEGSVARDDPSAERNEVAAATMGAELAPLGLTDGTDPNTADSDEDGAEEDANEDPVPDMNEVEEGFGKGDASRTVMGQSSTAKKTKRPPSVVTSVLQKTAAQGGPGNGEEASGDGHGDRDDGTVGSEAAGSTNTLTPKTPGTPAPVELQRKLTMEEWVNRSPDPIRGERMEPWPSLHEQIFSASRCTWIRPEFEVPGRLLVTQEAIYFDPDPPAAASLFVMRPSDAAAEDPHSLKDRELELVSIKRYEEELPEELFEHQLAAWRRFELRKQKQRDRKVWRLRDLDCILMRRYKMRDSAIEIFVQGQANESFFLNFEERLSCKILDSAGRNVVNVRERVVHGGHKERRNVVQQVLSLLPGDARRRSQRPGEPTKRLVDRYTERWQRREISNFEYLVWLNILSGRSVNDLTQYPVFPWVLADYESEELDLQNPSVYRDLSKPMGALTEDRLMEARERYHTFDDPNTPKFHYGSHYSTMAGVVLYFLVRMEPFTSLHITMQDGHFDIPDRLFGSVPATWRMCTTAMSEVKELTPEFYCMPEFLTNHNQFDLGTLQDGSKVGDVELPPWAKGCPHRFVSKMRLALESEHVSRNLHHWVDLIFGHKARLPDAVEADNVFYYLTYPGAVDLDSIEDPGMRLATELQVKHFGQCPEQIFTRPHPSRGDPPRPPFPLGVVLAGTYASDRFNSEGRNTMCVSSESGPVCGVHLLEGRVMVIHETGAVCGFVWGRSEMANRRDSESTEMDDEEYLSDADASVEQQQQPQRRRNGSTGAYARPLIVLPAPEAFETHSESDKELFCPPIHHLPVSSVRRQLRWTPPRASRGNPGASSGSGARREDGPETKAGSASGTSAAGSAEAGGRDVVLTSRADGRVLAHAGQGIGTVEVYFVDTDSGHFRAWSATLFAHMDDVTALALGTRSLASAGADGSLRVWTLRETSGPMNNEAWGVTSAPRLTLPGHTAPVQSLAVSDRQQVIVSASASMCLVHSLYNGRLLGKCEKASDEGATLVRVSDESGRIVVFAQATRTLYLYSSSRVGAPLAAVPTNGAIRDLVLTRQNLGVRAAELVLSVGEGNHEVTARSCDDGLATKGVFDVWPEEETPSALTALGLDATEEALVVGAVDGSICLFPLPNFISSGPDVRIAAVGALDVNAKIQQAKNAVLTKLDSARVLATARGVATEAAGVATKIGKGFLSVFGGGR